MKTILSVWPPVWLIALLLAASHLLDLGPDDQSSASATAQLASDSRFVVLSEGDKP